MKEEPTRAPNSEASLARGDSGLSPIFCLGALRQPYRIGLHPDGYYLLLAEYISQYGDGRGVIFRKTWRRYTDQHFETGESAYQYAVIQQDLMERFNYSPYRPLFPEFLDRSS